MMGIQEYLSKQEEDWKLLRKLDQACKLKKQFIGRYVITGFGDMACLYVLVDETAKKYILRFAWGECVHPDWGHKIKFAKSKIIEIIEGRDNIETIFPIRN